jgi:hypothetical protein
MRQRDLDNTEGATEMSKEALKLALEAITTYLSESPDPSEKAVEGLCDAASAARKALAAPAQEIVCSTGLCHYKPAAPDLKTELDATNKQVEILSDALAESRREVAALKELNT